MVPSAPVVPDTGVRNMHMLELAWGRADVMHLEVGEPGFAAPAHAMRAAAEAAANGLTKYSPPAGRPELRESLVAKLREVNGLPITGVDEVIVTSGGAHGLFAVFGAVLDPGSTVLMPDPGWTNFAMMAKLFGASPRFYNLNAANGYLPDPAELRSLIDETTRAVVFNSPSNPLGSVIPPELAEELYRVCAEKDVWIISDECYDQLDYGGRFVSFGTFESAPGRVLSVFSFSKVYAMTGLRVGYCALPTRVAQAALRVVGSSVMCANTPAQVAAHAALTGPQDFVVEWRDAYRANRDLALARLSRAGYTTHTPEGGFYVWMQVPDLGGRSTDEWAVDRLQQHGVAVTPGTSFGANGEGFVRVSLAAQRDEVAEGIERLLA